MGRARRPVLGQSYRQRKATQRDVDEYEARLAVIAKAPTREEQREGRTFVVRSLPENGRPR